MLKVETVVDRVPAASEPPEIFWPAVLAIIAIVITFAIVPALLTFIGKNPWNRDKDDL